MWGLGGEGGRGLLLPLKTTATDTSTRWRGSDNPASSGCIVISRLDYYNSVLASVPLATLEPLQRVQNAAARLIFELSPREHKTPSLLQLHWLPVSWRIQFKLCCIMHYLLDAQLISQTLYILKLLDSHALVYGPLQRQTINFRDSKPSSVSVRSHTLVRPRGTLCPATSVMSHRRTVLERF